MAVNLIVSALRNAWYFVTEPVLLRWYRISTYMENPTRWLGGLPPVSVYIPTRNRKRLLLDRCLPSVLNQTYPNMEIVVVCHGCTDGTADAVRALGDERIKVIEIPRRIRFPKTVDNFYFAARVEPSNAGLNECSGDWIATVDDDDEWMPDHLLESVRHAQRYDLEFVSSANVDGDGWVAPYNLGGVCVGAMQTWVYRSYLRNFRFNGSCWRKSWNRVCDTDLQARFRAMGVRMGYRPKVSAHIHAREQYARPGVRAYRDNPDTYLAEMS